MSNIETEHVTEYQKWQSILNVGTYNQSEGPTRWPQIRKGDKRLPRVVSVACSRMFREHQAKILLEDSLAAGANPHMVFFSSVDTLCELSLDKLKRAILVKVKFEDIKIWSDLVAPQGPYFQGNTGLVIGGLSLEAVQLAERTAGQRLFIPVVPGVDSLNSAMAASILLFEGRRQLLNLMETSGRKASSKVQVPF